MTDSSDDEKAALEDVIRSFSDAEVALREIAAESQRIRSATQQLGSAQAAVEAANEAVSVLVQSIGGVAGQLEESATALKSAATRLAQLDPQKVHAQLVALHNDVEASTRTVSEATSRQAEIAQTERARIAGEQTTRTDAIGGSLAILEGRLIRQGRLIIVVLLLVLVAAAASLYSMVAA